jgi:hypothetical protein
LVLVGSSLLVEELQSRGRTSTYRRRSSACAWMAAIHSFISASEGAVRYLGVAGKMNRLNLCHLNLESRALRLLYMSFCPDCGGTYDDHSAAT